MSIIIENKELREKLVKSAKESFDSELNASVMTRQMEELYISEYERKTAGGKN